MTERVSTGGNVSFQYQKDHEPKLKASQKKEIDEAYTQADERKRKAKRKKVILTAILVLIVIGAILAFTLL